MFLTRLAALSRPHWRVLAGVSAATYSFIKLVSEIAEGETRAVDAAILRAFRDPADLARPIGPRWLEAVMLDITALGSIVILGAVTALVVGYLLSEGKRRAAALIAIAVAGGSLAGTGLKLLIDRPRPELVPHLTEVTTLSFPSGHAMLSAVTYLTLGALLSRQIARRRTRIFVMASAVGLTVAVGVSRVYLGVHFPTDVIGGWCAGAAWAALCLIAAPGPAAPAEITAGTK